MINFFKVCGIVVPITSMIFVSYGCSNTNSATLIPATSDSTSTTPTTNDTSSSSIASDSRKNEPISPIVPETISADEQLKVALGEKLYFETRLSASQNISCNTCHNLSRGSSDNLVDSTGIKWAKEPTNTPAALNSKYNYAQFWDARAKNLRDQAEGPLTNPVEMGNTPDRIVKTLTSIPFYVKAFKEVYKTDQLTFTQVADAIATFEEKILVTPNARFDKWLEGDDNAINAQEKNGYKLFKSVGCIICHTGPAVGGVGKDTFYAKIGAYHEYKSTSSDLGIYDVTRKDSDKHKFKIPNLRNVALTAPYFHDGNMKTLDETVKAMGWLQLNKELTNQEVSDIVAFLHTLTGEQPRIVLPLLPRSEDNTPYPQD